MRRPDQPFRLDRFQPVYHGLADPTSLDKPGRRVKVLLVGDHQGKYLWQQVPPDMSLEYPQLWLIRPDYGYISYSNRANVRVLPRYDRQIYQVEALNYDPRRLGYLRQSQINADVKILRYLATSGPSTPSHIRYKLRWGDARIRQSLNRLLLCGLLGRTNDSFYLSQVQTGVLVPLRTWLLKKKLQYAGNAYLGRPSITIPDAPEPISDDLVRLHRKLCELYSSRQKPVSKRAFLRETGFYRPKHERLLKAAVDIGLVCNSPEGHAPTAAMVPAIEPFPYRNLGGDADTLNKSLQTQQDDIFDDAIAREKCDACEISEIFTKNALTSENRTTTFAPPSPLVVDYPIQYFPSIKTTVVQYRRQGNNRCAEVETSVSTKVVHGLSKLNPGEGGMTRDMVPLCLRPLHQWAPWRYFDGRYRRMKLIRSCDDSVTLKPNEPRTWHTLGEAIAAVNNPPLRPFNGIGLFLHRDLDHLFAIDLDSCITTDGSILPWAAEILRVCPTYTELSPSKTGLRIVGMGPEGWKSAYAFCYRSYGKHIGLKPSSPQKSADIQISLQGFNTITGNYYRDYSEVRHCNIGALITRLENAGKPPAPTSQVANRSVSSTRHTSDQCLGAYPSTQEVFRRLSKYNITAPSNDGSYTLSSLANCLADHYRYLTDGQMVEVVLMWHRDQNKIPLLEDESYEVQVAEIGRRIATARQKIGAGNARKAN